MLLAICFVHSFIYWKSLSNDIPGVASLQGTVHGKVKITYPFFCKSLTVERKKQSWSHTIYNPEQLRGQGHLLSRQRCFSQTAMGFVFPLWCDEGETVLPLDLFGEIIQTSIIHQRIPVEHSEDLKKSCFITFFKVLLSPNAISTTIKGQSSETVFLCTQGRMFSEESTGLLQRWGLAVLLASHILWSWVLIRNEGAVLVSLLMSEGKTHCDTLRAS